MRYTRRCPECGADDWMVLTDDITNGWKWETWVAITPLISMKPKALEQFRDLNIVYLNVCQCGLVVS